MCGVSGMTSPGNATDEQLYRMQPLADKAINGVRYDSKSGKQINGGGTPQANPYSQEIAKREEPAKAAAAKATADYAQLQQQQQEEVARRQAMYAEEQARAQAAAAAPPPPAAPPPEAPQTVTQQGPYKVTVTQSTDVGQSTDETTKKKPVSSGLTIAATPTTAGTGLNIGI